MAQAILYNKKGKNPLKGMNVEEKTASGDIELNSPVIVSGNTAKVSDTSVMSVYATLAGKYANTTYTPILQRCFPGYLYEYNDSGSTRLWNVTEDTLTNATGSSYPKGGNIIPLDDNHAVAWNLGTVSSSVMYLSKEEDGSVSLGTSQSFYTGYGSSSRALVNAVKLTNELLLITMDVESRDTQIYKPETKETLFNTTQSLSDYGASGEYVKDNLLVYYSAKNPQMLRVSNNNTLVQETYTVSGIDLSSSSYARLKRVNDRFMVMFIPKQTLKLMKWNEDYTTLTLVDESNFVVTKSYDLHYYYPISEEVNGICNWVLSGYHKEIYRLRIDTVNSKILKETYLETGLNNLAAMNYNDFISEYNRYHLVNSMNGIALNSATDGSTVKCLTVEG